MNITPLELRVLRAVESYQSSDVHVIAAAVDELVVAVEVALANLRVNALVAPEHLHDVRLWTTTTAGRHVAATMPGVFV